MLTQVTFANDSALKTIGKACFRESGLEQIAVPAMVTELDDCVFLKCEKLTAVTLTKDSGLVRIGKDCFSGSSIQTFEFPPLVREIGFGAFEYCRALRTVSLNEGLEALGTCDAQCNGIFCSSGLESVSLPTTLQTVGKDAFSGCRNLRIVMFAEGLRLIGRYGFSNCAIETAALPASLEEIQERAFFDNPLKDVTFRDGSRLQTVDDCVFGREGGGDKLARDDVKFPEGACVSNTAFGNSYFASSWM